MTYLFMLVHVNPIRAIQYIGEGYIKKLRLKAKNAHTSLTRMAEMYLFAPLLQEKKGQSKSKKRCKNIWNHNPKVT